MMPVVPLTFPYWIALITRLIGQGADAILEHQELGWVRHALCPLNVPDEELDTLPLKAAESMCRFLSRHLERNRGERIAHATAAGFMELNGYVLKIPQEKAKEYHRLMRMTRVGAADAEQLARYIAAFMERLPGYVRPNVPRPRGLVLLSVPVLGRDKERMPLEPWYVPLQAAVAEAGDSVGLELEVTCPARVLHGDPVRILDTWNAIFPMVDGQIVIGLKGETTGGGYEQVLLGLGRPWAWLRVGDASISTSLRSWKLLTGGDLKLVANPEEASAAVVSWIEQEANRFALSIYRRETARFLYYRVELAMRKQWLAPGVDRVKVARSAGLGVDLIDRLLTSVGLFGRVPLETLDSLASALGVAFDTAIAPRPLGTLEVPEEKALHTYVASRNLSGVETLTLRENGARLSGIERRRLGLGAPEGWETLHRGLDKPR